MKSIPIDQLHPHPKNPRLIIREDVITAILAGLTNGFHESHAIQVQANATGFVILSGHHRVEAAKRHGLKEVPCWVRDDLDDEAAYMLLATANAHGELSPLEIGMHALHYVAKAAGGRGKKGGLSEYAERVGKDAGDLSKYRNAARVVETLGTFQGFSVSTLLDKAAHLAAIHALPETAWPAAVVLMLKKELSAKDTKELVDVAAQGDTPKQIEWLFLGKTTHREISRIAEMVPAIASGFTYEKTKHEWAKWMAEEEPLDVKLVQSKRIELEDKEAELKAAEHPAAEAVQIPSLILADPPWKYDFAETDNRQIENHYPSATVEEIIDMRPETQPDCVLLLWATVAKLTEAMEVMQGWGFEYKTHAIWDKEKIGMGYWFRGQHELLLVGTRGKASPPEQENRVSSVFREPRGKHSAKPECVYSWIEKAFPELVKLEMFCRSPRTGWLVSGNESKK